MMTMDEMKRIAPQYQAEAAKKAAEAKAIERAQIEKHTQEFINELAEEVMSQVAQGKTSVSVRSRRIYDFGNGMAAFIGRTSRKMNSGRNKGGFYETLGHKINLQMVKDYFKMHGVPLEVYRGATYYPIVAGSSCSRCYIDFKL